MCGRKNWSKVSQILYQIAKTAQQIAKQNLPIPEEVIEIRRFK